MERARYREAERRLWDAHGATPTEQRVVLAATGTAVRVQEVGAGAPVVFLHGANTSGASWIALAARLTGRRCLVVDRPGTGLSDPPRARPTRASIAALGDRFLGDLLDGLGLERADVVATSFGGYLALRSAAADPERIGRMVQVSWPVGAPIRWLPAFMRVLAVPGVGRLLAALPASERSARLTFRRIGHARSLAEGRITPLDLAVYVALLRHTPTLRHELGVADVFVSPLRGLDRMLLPDDLLARVRAPTLFLWGEEDPFGGPEVGRAIAARMPDARLEILPATGHAPWFDHPDRCVAAIDAFLGGRS